MLNNLSKIFGNKKPAKRRGQGGGSGKGFHTTGRGHKGQGARAGKGTSLGFEGGQTPLHKKLPQIGGFKNFAKRDVVSLRIDILNGIETEKLLQPSDLHALKYFKTLPKHGVKFVSGFETLNKSNIELNGFLFSASAKKAAEEAGYKIS